MSNVNTLIAERLSKKEVSSKMNAMAERSASGGLSTFNGLFQVVEMSPQEKGMLEELLTYYAIDSKTITKDLNHLIGLTSEIKAINHQAALLHGERIKKAQAILLNYKEGAFTQWLISTYGNRQTPYNLILYYDFYQMTPPHLKEILEKMPRQAIYTLASRQGEKSKKYEFISKYNGETKQLLLLKIRELFPLPEVDRRKENPAEQAVKCLMKAHLLLSRKMRLRAQDKESLKEWLQKLSSQLKQLT